MRIRASPTAPGKSKIQNHTAEKECKRSSATMFDVKTAKNNHTSDEYPPIPIKYRENITAYGVKRRQKIFRVVPTK